MTISTSSCKEPDLEPQSRFLNVILVYFFISYFFEIVIDLLLAQAKYDGPRFHPTFRKSEVVLVVLYTYYVRREFSEKGMPISSELD